jgi:prepilin-type N-terminal cleavage/methylation domain-containing protein
VNLTAVLIHAEKPKHGRTNTSTCCHTGSSSVKRNRRQLEFMALNHHRDFGYTLMELLCVIAIITIIAAIYSGAIAKALFYVKKPFGK